jgi:hypothetical protein
MIMSQSYESFEVCMPKFQPLLSVLKDWGPLASALAAWTAVLVSWKNARTAGGNLQLAEKQEQRRRPTLVPYLADGYSEAKGNHRLLAFSVSLSNPSDTNNSIAQIELALSYTTPTGVFMTMKLPVSVLGSATVGDVKLLEPPLKIDAHQSVSGWVFFEIKNELIKGCRLDTYILQFQDSHGHINSLEQAIVRELISEKAERRHLSTQP